MIRKIHWANAALQLDTLLKEVDLAKQHYPGLTTSIFPVGVYRHFVTLAKVRNHFFGPFSLNIGFPQADAVILKRLEEGEPYEVVTCDDDPRSLQTVVEFLLLARLQFELAKARFLEDDYRVAL